MNLPFLRGLKGAFIEARSLPVSAVKAQGVTYANATMSSARITPEMLLAFTGLKQQPEQTL